MGRANPHGRPRPREKFENRMRRCGCISDGVLRLKWIDYNGHLSGCLLQSDLQFGHGWRSMDRVGLGRRVPNAATRCHAVYVWKCIFTFLHEVHENRTWLTCQSVILGYRPQAHSRCVGPAMRPLPGSQLRAPELMVACMCTRGDEPKAQALFPPEVIEALARIGRRKTREATATTDAKQPLRQSVRQGATTAGCGRFDSSRRADVEASRAHGVWNCAAGRDRGLRPNGCVESRRRRRRARLGPNLTRSAPTDRSGPTGIPRTDSDV